MLLCFTMSQHVIFKERFLLSLTCAWPCSVPAMSYMLELCGKAVGEDWSARMKTVYGQQWPRFHFALFSHTWLFFRKKKEVCRCKLVVQHVDSVKSLSRLKRILKKKIIFLKSRQFVLTAAHHGVSIYQCEKWILCCA